MFMKSCITFLFILVSIIVFAQTPETKKLTRDEINQLLPDSTKKKFNIGYPVFRAFKCTDKSGECFVVLTESADSIANNKDTMHHKIKAICLAKTKNGLSRKWEISDFIFKQNNEYNIWFWTKFSEFEDIDKDGFIDPVLIYGTWGMNNYDDGRVKILVFYKGVKYAIRHQNGPLDYERNTQVDAAYYTLPAVVQKRVQQIMEKIVENNLAIFPYGWQNAMKNKKIKFDEKTK